MPRQDAYGRWVTDDGASYWDGREWQPMAAITGYPMYAVQARGAPIPGAGRRGWRSLFKRTASGKGGRPEPPTATS